MFRIHLIYSIIEGIILGALALNEFIFLKSLHGTNFQLGVLFQFSTVVLLVTVILNQVVKRFRKKKLLRIVALITRLPLALLAFFPVGHEYHQAGSIYHYIFLAIFLLFYLAQPIILPTINLFLKTNYKASHFGRLYSIATSTNKIVMLVITFLFGLLLDFDNYAFTYIYPLLAVLGISSIYLLSLLDPGIEPERNGGGIMSSAWQSVIRMKDIILSNKPYRDFEIGFMLYGFSFMLTISVITIFLAEELDLNYSSIAFYKNAYNIIAIILLPFFGKMLDSIDPRKFASITFLSLLLYILFIGITEYVPFSTEIFGLQIYYMLIVAFIFHGFFAATMGILWAIGSAYFCRNEESADYQSVHLTLVGARASFAPLLGVGLYEIIGFSRNFRAGRIFPCIVNCSYADIHVPPPQGR